MVAQFLRFDFVESGIDFILAERKRFMAVHTSNLHRNSVEGTGLVNLLILIKYTTSLLIRTGHYGQTGKGFLKVQRAVILCRSGSGGEESLKRAAV